LNPASPGLKLTDDDFLLFPDDRKRHELIDGEHYVTPSPNTKDQRVSGNIFLAIGSHDVERRVTPLLSGLTLLLAKIFRE